MRSLRIFSLIVSLFFVAGLYGLCLAQNPTPSKTVDNECSWTAGKTSVSDLSPEEKKKLLGLKLPEGYWEQRETAKKLEMPKAPSLPIRFDWRDLGGVTAVKNQGGCGSCWDFCAVGALESMVKIYGEVEMDLSEQQVLSCKTYGWGCDGAWPEYAFELFESPGSAKEECMPYQANDEIPCTQASCGKWAKISSWTPVGYNVDSLKSAIYYYGPISVLMAVPDTFFSYTSGCFDYFYYDINHCVLLVGWDDTLCNGQGAWIVKNSWGQGWGMNGFFYIRWGRCAIGQGANVIRYVFHRPLVRVLDFGVNDETSGDGDGRPEPGEIVRLDFTLYNAWSPLGDVGVTVSADTGGIILTDNYSDLGDMDSKDTLNNSLDPMWFQVPHDFPAKRVYFTFHVSGDSGGGVIYTMDTTTEVLVGRQILLVDDDQGADSLGTNHENYFVKAFDSLKVVYDIWNKMENPDTICDFSDYDILVWFTGNHRDSVFSQSDVESLMSFLDNGGGLFLTSQDAVEALSSSSDPWDTLFLKHYLHVSYNGNSGRNFVAGEPGDEIGDTLWIYPKATPGANNQTSKDNLVPDSEADIVLFYANNGFVPTDTVAGTKFQSDYFKVVVFGFGFEAINGSGNYYQGHWLTRPQLVMQRVLNWLKTRPTINVMSPNGGEAWFADSTYDIFWESISFDDSVKIEYSINGGNGWLTLVDTTTNDGMFFWTVPDTASNNCLVRISDVANGIPSDTSEGCFFVFNYLPGNVNGDGVVDVGDVVYLINYLFKGGDPPVPLSSGDTNRDCVLDVGDVVSLINYLFKGGDPPQPGCA